MPKEFKFLKNIQLNCSLSVEVWSSLRNNGSYLNKNDMTDKQKTECKHLSDFLNNQVKQLGYETRDQLFRKSYQGYSVYRYCNESNCTSTWLLTANVSDLKGKIYLNKNCRHID